MIALLEELEVAADETLDIDDVEYDEVCFVFVADVLALREMRDNVGIACLDEN